MKFVEFLKVQRGLESPINDRYGDWLGYVIEDFDKKKRELTTSLKIRRDHLSPSQAVHGGVVSGFLDFTCGCAVFGVIDIDQLCSTVDLNVKYFKPLKEGDEIIALAKVIHLGRTLSSVSAEIYKRGKEGIPVAMATGTFNIYKLKS